MTKDMRYIHFMDIIAKLSDYKRERGTEKGREQKET